MKHIITVIIIMTAALCAKGQFAVKTNLLYDATTTPNIGAELRVGSRSTVNLVYGLNPWTFSSETHGQRKAKHWVLMPEYRWWTCSAFNGHFLGVHAFGGQMNASNVSIPLPGGFFGGDNIASEVKRHRYQGEFAAAVSNAGALGLIGAGGMNADMLREHIRRCKELTEKPFGVNIMLMNPAAPEMAQVVIEEGVKVVTTGAGVPSQFVPAWKEAGIKVFPVVPATTLVKRLEPLGVDGFIAEGTESGGHVGELTTMALVPQVIDAVDVPVIAAGGIAGGKQLAAAFALGACGAQVGTCLLVSEECPIHDNYKQAVLKAKDSDTTVTGRSVNAPVRILKNQMSREYLKLERAGAERMELEKFTLGSLRRAVFDGDTKTGSLMCGQNAGLLHEIRPLRAILEELCSICHETAQQLAQEV